MGNTTSAEAAGAGEATPERTLVSLSHDAKMVSTIDINDIIEIAYKAGKVIMDIFHQEKDAWEVDHKADDSPLTKADRQANAVICDALSALTPHIPIISEENKMVSYSTRKNYQYCWIVDPLDGTKEFIKRVPHFTVNIALVKGTQPVLGVVCTPGAASMHFAVKGQGAWVRSETGSDKQIRCARYDPSAPGMVVVGSASHMNRETKDFMKQFKEPHIKQIGSSLKFLLVAEGLAHVYPRLAPTCEWDTAAAHIIVEEAGGSVIQAGRCDAKGQPLEDWRSIVALDEPVEYNKSNVLNPFFIVYGERGSSDNTAVAPASESEAAGGA